MVKHEEMLGYFRSGYAKKNVRRGIASGSEPRRPLHIYVPLAQLDRAFDYESKGREFESLRARHFNP